MNRAATAISSALLPAAAILAYPAAVPQIDSAPPLPATATRGELVSAIDKSCWVIFQDKSNNYWFGSDGKGAYRFDGKNIIRFTTKHGLAHDHVRGIQQHLPSGDILVTTNDGVSKFDGRRFITLPITETKPPTDALTPAATVDPGWVLSPDDLWLIGTGGPRRYDGKTLYQLKFPKCPLEEELTARIPHHDNWSPYDVWTVYKDRRGDMWFGTGMFGICRFDGKTFDWIFEPHLTEVPGGGWFGFRSILEDRSGDFWFCNTQFRYKIQPNDSTETLSRRLKYTRENGINLAGSATTDKFFYFQSITEDNNRDFWMSPYAGGVWKYDGKTVTHYPMKNGDAEITMISIYRDTRGDIWVATDEHGPFRFNGTAFERFKP